MPEARGGDAHGGLRDAVAERQRSLRPVQPELAAAAVSRHLGNQVALLKEEAGKGGEP